MVITNTPVIIIQGLIYVLPSGLGPCVLSLVRGCENRLYRKVCIFIFISHFIKACCPVELITILIIVNSISVYFLITIVCLIPLSSISDNFASINLDEIV